MKVDIIKNNKYLTAGIIIFLIVLGSVIRARGLGKWCVNSDEYLLFQSTSYIHDLGFPKFPSGGYYVRGIALQYLMAFTTWVFPNKEFGLRLVPLIFGVLTIPMFYLFCKKLIPTIPALMCSLILLLSSWHIEFSRFARFYTTFQFMFFLFLYFFYIGYLENENKYVLLSLVVALISVFIFEASLFLPIIVFIFILLRENKLNKHTYINSILVLFLLLTNYLINGGGINFNRGVINALPQDLITVTSNNIFEKIPIHLPSMHILSQVWGSLSTIMFYFSIVFFGLYLGHILYQYQKEKSLNMWSSIFIILTIFLPLFHLYALLGILVVIILSNRKETYTLYLHNRIIINSYILITILFWISIVVLTGNGNKIMHYLVGYPLFKPYIIKPFYESIPKWGLYASAIVGISVIHNVFSEKCTKTNFTLTVLLLCILLVSFFKLPEYTTRYSFFLFPLIIILVYQEMDCFVNWISTKFKWQKRIFQNTCIIIPLFLFSVTEDINISHVIDVSSMEANFRMGEYGQFQEHWYERFDYKTPALYVNKYIKNGEWVIIDSNPFSAYLTTKVIFYSPRDTYWFEQFSRNFGREEKWSGHKMISDISLIIDAVPKNKNNSLWIISQDQIAGGIYIKDFANSNKINIKMKYVGLDGRFKVWQLKRK